MKNKLVRAIILATATITALTLTSSCAKTDSDGTGTLAALFAGSAPNSTDAIPTVGEPAAEMINAESGGVIRLGDSITFTIPAGSLEKDTEIKIEELTSAPDGGAGSSFQIAGRAFRFSPPGTQFAPDKPAILRMKYDKSSVTAKGLEAKTMQMFYFDVSQNAYVNVTGGVDTTAGEITAEIEHFTIFLVMAQAKAASGNNLPTALMQATYPNTPIHGAPLHFRATAGDFLDADGAVVSVELFLERTTAGIASQKVCDMTRETRTLGASGTSNVYNCTLAGDSFDATDKGGTGANDIQYFVRVTDNHGGFQDSPTQGRNLDARDLNPAVVTLTPGIHDMTAGSHRNFILRVGHTGGGGTVPVVPISANTNIGSGSATILGRDASGIRIRATTTGQFTLDVSLNNGLLPLQSTVDVFTAGLSDCFDFGLTTKCGGIRITDASQNAFPGTVEIVDGHSYQFDVVGYDAFGNTVPVNAAVNILPVDADIGTISSQGVYYALDGRSDDAFGKITATIGGLTATQFVHVKERTWQDKSGIAAEGSTSTAQVALTLRNGTPWVAHAQDNSSQSQHQIHVRSWNGITWVSHNAQDQLSVSAAHDGVFPDIVTDGNFVYVAWMQDLRIHVRRNSGFGNAWLDIASSLPSNALNIDPSRQANRVKMAVDPSTNNVYVVWEEVVGANQRLYVRRWNAGTGTWDIIGGPVNNSTNNAGLGTIVHDGTDVYVAFREHDGTAEQIYVRRYDSILGWVDVVTGSLNVDVNLDAQSPHIALFGSTPYVTWHEIDGGGINQVHVRRFNSGTNAWDLVGGPLNEVAEDATNAQIAFDPMGSPYVTFQQSDAGTERILVKHYNSTLASWRLDSTTSGLNTSPSNDAVLPVIAMDNYTPWVVWIEDFSGIALPYPASLKIKPELVP